MLLGQIASEIEGKRLLIVGDGVLQYVPFAALPKPVNANSTAAVGEPLIASNEIVSLPSASTLAILRREEMARPNRKPYAKTVVVFADPVFDTDDNRVSAIGGQVKKPDSNAPPADMQSTVLRSANEAGLTSRGGLRRLVRSKDEAEAIRNTAANGQATIAMSFDASRERVMAGNFAEYRIVHFATHGLLNEENPELSGVVLSLVDQQGNQQNGFLRLHEIFNLNLPVEMVVLSACQTGLGKKIKGEGLVGLTRGFMYAGAPRVVASLWSVDDRATAELMGIFYRKMLREGLSPAAALRQAQNELRQQERWLSPVYWAGFALQGEWRNIGSNKK
jgi:CHAT domain-containing protein